MDVSIDQIKDLVNQAIALNNINSDDKIKSSLQGILDRIHRDLNVYKIEENRRSNLRSVEIANVEKKIRKEFADMTTSIMDLVKIKSLP